MLLPVAGITWAQEDPGACPYLATESGLVWEHRGSDKHDFCRALRADGSEAFGVNISAKVPFKPKGGNRAERVTIEGREVIWYRTEIAGSDIEVRETLVELPDGRKAHMWLQANSPDQLREILRQTESLKFTTRLSQN